MRLYNWGVLLLLLFVSPCHSQDAPKHLIIAKSYVGTVEKTGHNDGQKIEYIIKRGGGVKGASYCAYFVGLCIDSAGAVSPRMSGMAIGYKKKSSISADDVLIGKVKPPPGSIIIWRKGNTIFGHTGFVNSWGKRYGTTVEGNTSSGVAGSQSNGDGIWERKRSIEPMNYFRITNFTLVKY